MNNVKRKLLKAAIEQLTEAQKIFENAKEIVEGVRDEEQECFDNLTEGLQASERGQKMEETASTLDDICNDLEMDFDDLISRLEESME